MAARRPAGKKKHHTFSSTAGARPTIPTIIGMVIEEVRPVFATPTYFDPISIVSPLNYWKFEGKCPHRGKILITWLFVHRKQPNEKLKIHLETRTKSENFVKTVQTSDPWGANSWPKFEIWVLGVVFPHFSPDKREIRHGGAVRSPVPNFTFTGATCRPCGAKKTIFGSLSKNNTGRQAGCATRLACR